MIRGKCSVEILWLVVLLMYFVAKLRWRYMCEEGGACEMPLIV